MTPIQQTRRAIADHFARIAGAPCDFTFRDGEHYTVTIESTDPEAVARVAQHIKETGGTIEETAVSEELRCAAVYFNNVGT